MRSSNALAMEGEGVGYHRSSVPILPDLVGGESRYPATVAVSRLGGASEHGVRRGTCPYGSR